MSSSFVSCVASFSGMSISVFSNVYCLRLVYLVLPVFWIVYFVLPLRCSLKFFFLILKAMYHNIIVLIKYNEHDKIMSAMSGYNKRQWYIHFTWMAVQQNVYCGLYHCIYFIWRCELGVYCNIKRVNVYKMSTFSSVNSQQ